MAPAAWTRTEVEAICEDYLAMLGAELSGVTYSKAEHRRRLVPKLDGRSHASIEFKHQNITAALLDLGFPTIHGYKRRNNYQALLVDVLVDTLSAGHPLHALASHDAERPIVVPEVADILAVLTVPPRAPNEVAAAREVREQRAIRPLPFQVDYLARESRNRSLGAAGELFAFRYEQARLTALGKGSLAARVEHTSRTRGDGAGYDILSYEANGAERLVEVKTTKYGQETPFYVSANEVRVSETHAEQYHVYRLFAFCRDPRLYALAGSIRTTCQLSPTTFVAQPC
jgi:hypothetical protein